MSCEQVLTQELRARGLRRTPQREMVLSALHELGGHASVEEAYQQVRRLSESVEKSTVYRTLELLHELGLVIQVDVGDNILRYALTGHGTHSHLVCSACGRIEEVGLAGLDVLRSELAHSSDFDLADHQVLKGICRRCRQLPGAPRNGTE